jgi:D-alanyl-D-alanine dipeptidase
VVVTAPDWNSHLGTLQLFDRGPSGWRPASEPIRVVLGKEGLAWGAGVARAEGFPGPVKREGDGRSPAGIFRLGPAFGADPNAGLQVPYQRLTASWECVDDPDSKSYNRVLDASAAKRDWRSSERMLIPLYRLGMIVEHNAKGEKALGSCIFLHVTGTEGTESAGTLGCTAMDEPALKALLNLLQPAAKPVLVQLPEDEYQQLRKTWDLP